MHALAVLPLALRLGAQVILHVARVARRVGRVLPLELLEHRAHWLVEHVSEHVDAAAMRHRHHDQSRAGRGRAFDRRLEHRHQRVVPLDRKALVALIGAAEEALEPVDFGEAAQHGALLLVRERAAHLTFLDHAPEPRTLGVALDVLELEADGGRVDAAEAGDGVGRRGVGLEAERGARNGREVSLGYAVELALELGGARRSGGERVDLDGEMAVLANCLHEGRGTGDFA